MDYSNVRGFNYQPSYAATSMEAWLYFDEKLIEKEISNGVMHFPKINTIRIWLSYGAYLQDKQLFEKNFQKTLKCCKKYNLKVIPCLFNRWHNTFADNDGVYLDGLEASYENYLGTSFFDYIDDIVGKNRENNSILLWDLCNEPFSFSKPLAELETYAKEDSVFLQRIAQRVKKHEPMAQVGISLSGHDWKNAVELIVDLCDVLLIHPYLMEPDNKADMINKKKEFLECLDFQVEYARLQKKPLLVTETCWGSVENKRRRDNIAFNLNALVERNIGFLAHALYYSDVADLHWVNGGEMGDDFGVFHFIEKDGSVREEHQIFNDYCNLEGGR